MFSNHLCHKIALKYRLAVYGHCEEGPVEQSKAVKAVLYHELDHKDVTPDLGTFRRDDF